MLGKGLPSQSPDHILQNVLGLDSQALSGRVIDIGELLRPNKLLAQDSTPFRLDRRVFTGLHETRGFGQCGGII